LSVQPLAPRGSLQEAWFLSKALLRNRALAIRRDWEDRSLYGFALIFGATVFCVILLGTLAGVRVLEAASAIALLRSIPSWAFLIYLFTDVLIAFGQALGDLYLSRDMPTLLGLPVRTSSIVVAKFLLGVAQNEVYAAIFLLPFVLGYLAGTQAVWWAYAIGITSVLIFPAILYAVLVVVTILALRVIPPRLAKEGLWLVGASVPTVFWFLSFYRVAHLGGTISAMKLPPPPAWLPSTWIGNVVAQFGAGDTVAALQWFAVLAFSTFVACPAAMAIVSRNFAKGWSAAVSAPARRPGRRLGGGSSSPAGAVAGKDLVTFIRSPQLWFNHVAALGFVAYLLVGHGVSTSLLPLSTQLAMVQMGFVAVLGALNPGMTALSLEHKGIWILKSAPLLGRDILAAKFGVAYLQTGTIAAVGGAALASGYGFSAEKMLAVVAFALAASASSVCVGIAFDASFPSFDWDNPNHINRGLRMIVPFLVNLGVLVLCSILLFVTLAAQRHGILAAAAGLAICLGLYGITAIESMRIARRNLEALEV
jgi:ABC-2 type transport system permease protein